MSSKIAYKKSPTLKSVKSIKSMLSQKSSNYKKMNSNNLFERRKSILEKASNYIK